MCIIAHTYLKRAVAKDFGENRGREVGDDRQDDCYAGCENDDVDFTGCLQKTVTSNISLTDLKITKNGVTQSFLESLYHFDILMI